MAKSPFFGTVHDELLDVRRGDLEWLGELGLLNHKIESDFVVHLRHLLKESSKDDLLKRLDILLHVFIVADLGENWRDLLTDDQWMKVDFKDVVEISDLGCCSPQ